MLQHWPQTLILFLFVLNFTVAGLSAGKPKRPWNPVASLIDGGLSIAILYWGGFFAVWGWAP